VEREGQLARNPFTFDTSGLRYFILNSDTLLAFLPPSDNRLDLQIILRDEGGRFVLSLLAFFELIMSIQVRLEPL
jgi:hypothetical protein